MCLACLLGFNQDHRDDGDPLALAGALGTGVYGATLVPGPVPDGPSGLAEGTDAAAGTSTAYSLAPSQTLQGTLYDNGDHDWYRVDLVAGQTYTFAMTGIGANNVIDPYLRLYNSSGTVLLAENDDGLQGGNSVFTYTATATGAHFIDAAAYNNSGTGQYGISVTAGSRASFDTQMGAGVIDTDYSWSTPGNGAVVTYAFRATDSGDETNFSQLTSAQKAAVQSVLAMYAEVCGLSFTAVNPGGYSDNATMLFSNYAANDGAGAYAYYPGSTAAASRSGDVYLNTNSVSTTSLPAGAYSYYAIAHEIGHAVGLSHPGLYNAAPGVSITYAGNAQFTQDTHQYSVMSYFDESYTTASYGSYPDTLMLFDIYALQQIYGADYATRAGNTVYGFNSNAGGVYDFTLNSNPAMCIWDGAGVDTLDCSGFSQSQVISLVDGTFSNIGGRTGNISIALGAMIENVTGGSGSDTIYGNGLANTLMGGGGNDYLYGGLGGDSLNGGNGADSLDGSGGTDIAAFNTLSRTYAKTWSGSTGDGSIASGSAEGTDTLNDVEILSFLDGYYLAGNAAVVARMYDSAFDRAADFGGLLGWTAQLDYGMTVTSLAGNFMGSQEFILTYGGLSNSQFVTLLYNNVLDRPPDQGGLDYWVGELNSNHATRADILYGFSESPEHIFMLQSETVGGAVWWLDNDAGAVARLYYATLDRAPDAGGLDHWIDAYNSGTAFDTIASGFINSAEFQNVYGALDNTGFVTLLYNNVLDRAPDSTGLNYWVGGLNSGAFAREDVVVGFNNSDEFIQATFPYMNDGIMLG